MPKQNISKLDRTWPYKSYNNLEFLSSPAARNIRILSEMIEPAHRLRKENVSNTVSFFGSARTLSRQQALKNLKEIKKKGKTSEQALQKAERDLHMSRYYEDACELSFKLTKWFNKINKYTRSFVICSGGGPGIMEAANKGAKKAEGKSMGLNISLPMEQHPNKFQTKELAFEFHYFFIRKFWFFYPSKALVIFPGGFGTFDEFFELLTLIQTEKTKKYMPVILYGSEYWNEVINFKALVKWGTISKKDLNLFKMSDSVDETFNYLKEKLTKYYL